MKPRVDDMTPKLRELYDQWKQKMEEAGIPFILTCVLRTKAEQEALYAQGRHPLEYVNKIRRECGMAPISTRENSYKVTWTMNSKHFAGPDGKGRAFDFCIVKQGTKQLTWDTKWDADNDGVPEYLEAARFAKEVGLDSGAFWEGSKDYPHIQLKLVKRI